MPLKTPLVLQMEEVECGAAALGIVLEYYGRVVPLSELRVECGVSRDGSRASSLVRAARRYGMQAKGYKKSLESIREAKLPAIVFWNFNHFVVLEGFRGDSVFINDPASGRRVVTRAEFDEAFTGVVLILEPGPEFTRGGSRPSLLGALRRHVRGALPGLLFCALAGLFMVVPGMAFPVLTQVFVDAVIIEGRLGWLAPLVAAMVGVIALQGALLFLQYRRLIDLRIKLSVGMSSRFLWHVLRLPIGYFSQRYSGEVASRVGLNEDVADVLAKKVVGTLIDCAMIVFYAGLMLYYDPFLTAVGVAAALANVLTLRVVSRARKAANMRELQEVGKLHGVAVAGLQSIETLKASAQEASFFSRWAGHHAKALNAKQSLALADQALAVLPGLLAGLASLLVLVLGGVRVIEGAMTVGMLIAFRGLLSGFQRPVDTLVGMGTSLQTLEGDVHRLDDVLREASDPLAEPRPRVGDEAPRLDGLIEVQDLSFGYSPGDPPLLKEFNLRVAPGQRVALVGPSGSGKSTLARLVAGLQQPWSGSVQLDGRRLAHIPRRVLASSLALVEQDPAFFAGSVHDNLTLWDPTVPTEQLERAARDAEVQDLIRSLPGGYGHMLLEGAMNLSGGQRQRLEIARALVLDPSILILDEATSSLDPETERRIDRNLRVRGCTCLVIAHRLSTIRDCDEIIVLDEGHVLERGTYEQLRARDGAFGALLEELAEGGAEGGERD